MDMTSKAITTPEFSRPLEIETVVPDRARIEELAATAEECAALSKRFGLRLLSDFKARLNILRVSEGNIIRVQGDIRADVVQACVVSLQDVPAHIEVSFDTSFSEKGEIFEDDDLDIAFDDDLHEVMNEGKIDLGELVAQYLSLELEPYPRAPGVSLAAQMAEVGGEAKNRPFEVLQGLKKDKDE